MEGPKVRLSTKRFRNSMTHGAGNTPTVTQQARVLNVNMVNWTVDVVTQFDRHWYSDIQVSSLYLHYDNGEGVYVMPEVGAVCMVCVPSDTSPPFIMGFLGPMEVRGGAQLQNPTDPSKSITTTVFGTQGVADNAATNDDAPDGTRSRGGSVPNPDTDAAFSSGRPAYNPGDIVMRTRDDNFVILHRGGVVSIGATELSQRIYIPLGNKILDMSGEYEHDNIGGSVHWGIQQGPLVQNPACQEIETYRVYANDQYASLRVARGKVLNPIGAPDGQSSNIGEYGIGTDAKNPLCYEIAVTQGGASGFKTVSGDPSDGNVRNSVKLRFIFDLSGNTLLRASGNAVFEGGKRLKISVAEDMVVRAKTVDILATDSARMGGTALTEVTGNLVKFSAGGGLPAARQGDAIQVSMLGVVMTGTLSCAPLGPSPQPAVFTIIATVPAPGGIIVTGNPSIQM